MRKTTKSPGAKIVKDIKRATRKQYSSEDVKGSIVCVADIRSPRNESRLASITAVRDRAVLGK